jgi:hypothetical protein
MKDMKTRFPLHLSFLVVLILAAGAACNTVQQTIPLATFTENDVDVSLNLSQQPSGKFLLEASFTPPDGYHLYSKDIPPAGVDGLGRPTLLELTPNSLMKSAGLLSESVGSQTPNFEPRELLVYPAGAVTLRLPVHLPAGADWIQDEVQVTYMACSAGQCKPPVEARIIPVRIPGAGAADSK